MSIRRTLGVVVALAVAPCAFASRGEPLAQLFPDTFHAPGTGQVTGKANAIVIVHGWTSDPDAWANDMRSLINTQLGAAAANWDIWVLDWREDAAASGGVGDLAPGLDNMIRAQKQGHYVAKTLMNQNYQNIQLIGHSLGGRVIESAATMLRQGSTASVHTTFLDAYTPANWDLIYGSTSAWSEHYYNRNTSNNPFNPDDAPLTESKFPNAMNVDVTAIHDAMPQNYPYGLASWNHNWPQRFYRQSISGYNAQNPPFNGYGYRLSKEIQGANWPAPGFNRATNVVITPNAAPAITNIDTTWVSNNTPMNIGTLKNSQNADAAAGTLTLHAASGLPVWATMNFTVTQPINFFEFDFQFHGVPGEKTLSFFVYRDGGQASDYTLLYQADDVNRLVGPGFEHTGKLGYWYGNLAAGVHTLAFRLDTTSDIGDVQIRNLYGALLAVPAPGGGALLMVVVIAGGRRSRRAA